MNSLISVSKFIGLQFAQSAVLACTLCDIP